MDRELNNVLNSIKRELHIIQRWDSTITKGRYVVAHVGYDLANTFEIEVAIQMMLESLTDIYNIHFSYEFFEDMIKIYPLM